MTKKHITEYFLVTGLLILIYSCNKDKLTINPADQYTVETFWKTEEHASAGLLGCYQVLRSVYGGGWVYETDIVTPNAMGNRGSALNPLAKGVQLTTDGAIAGRWNVNYQGIGRTNTFLDKIGGITMNTQLKDRMIGEAKFLRALYYFNLVNVFGGVPLILETPDAAKHSKLPRDTKEKVTDQILKDLNEAAAALPLKYTAKDAGRATKGAALALKARLLLYDE
ncbi:MAG: RagB/SusD family nutrient uptake outer membrane protein, partial [Daejeonella sp.]